MHFASKVSEVDCCQADDLLELIGGGRSRVPSLPTASSIAGVKLPRLSKYFRNFLMDLRARNSVPFETI